MILGVCIIYNPQGIYYGGTIAAPVMKTIFENVLAVSGIEKTEVVTEESKQNDRIPEFAEACGITVAE